MATDMIPCASPIYRLKENQDVETMEAEVISISLDLQKFNTLKEFTTELEKYGRRNKKQIPQKKKQKVSEFSYMPSSGYVPQELIFSALRKCMTNEAFWSAKGLDILLENNYITPGFDDDLIFSCILKYKSYTSLKLIARYFEVVADKYIIKTLKSILKSVVIEESRSLHTNLYSIGCPVSDKVIADLSYTMMLPVNKMSLKEYLKLLTLNEALIFLQCLNFMLHIVSPALVEGPLKSNLCEGEEITERLVVMWLDLLLTAHLMSFATSQTLHSLIPDIRLCINKQQCYYSNISRLASFLRYVREERTTIENMQKPIGKYTLETITM